MNRNGVIKVSTYETSYTKEVITLFSNSVVNYITFTYL